MSRRNVGKIRISSDLLLKWIDYADANLRDARYDFPSDSIELLIESPELPELERGVEPPILNPLYVQYQDAMGNKVTMRKRV